MDVGVTIPNGVPGIDGRALLEWATRAEACGFSTAGVISRIAYPSHEELITLAAVAGATERIKLMPTVMIAPLRDPVLLAKQTATLDRLSDGRLVLGLGAGMRPDDFVATSTRFEDRGRRFDEMLETMHALWRGEPATPDAQPVCPPPVRGRVPIYFGALANSPRIVSRVARWGDGFIPVGGPQMVAPLVDALRDAWAREGRDGTLRLVGASYFVLGDESEAERNILDYYGDFFPALGQAAAAAMPRTPDAIRTVLAVYRDAGYDEVLLSGAAADPAQVERLAGIVFA